jgi:hypothetical protein
MKYSRTAQVIDQPDPAIDSLRAMVTAQSALIFGLLTVLAEHRIVPRSELRAVFETAIDMVDHVDPGIPGAMPHGVQAARDWLQRLLDDMPPGFSD